MLVLRFTACAGRQQVTVCVCVCADSAPAQKSWILSGSADCTAKLWEFFPPGADDAPPAAWNCLSTFECHKDWVSAVQFAVNGSVAVTGGWDGKIAVWKLPADASAHIQKRDQPDQSIESAHSERIRAIAVSPIKPAVGATPDFQYLLSGSNDETAKLWRLPLTRKPEESSASEWEVGQLQALATLRGHADFVNSVTFNHDASLCATGSNDQMMKVWDMSDEVALAGTNLFRGHRGTPVTAVCFSLDGTRLVSSSGFLGHKPEPGDDVSVRVWDVPQMEQRGSSDPRWHVAPWKGLAIEQVVGGKEVVGSKDAAGAVHLWSLDDEQLLGILNVDGTFVVPGQAAADPNAHELASAAKEVASKLKVSSPALDSSAMSSVCASCGPVCKLRTTSAVCTRLAGSGSSRCQSRFLSHAVAMWQLKAVGSWQDLAVDDPTTTQNGQDKTKARTPVEVPSKDSKFVVCGEGDMVIIYPLSLGTRGKPLGCYYAPGRVECVAINGSLIAAGCRSGDVLVLNADDILKPRSS